MSIIDLFLKANPEFERASIEEADRLNNLPFNPDKVKPTNNVKTMAADWFISCDILMECYRTDWGIGGVIVGYKQSTPYILHKFTIIQELEYPTGDCKLFKLLKQILTYRMKYLFSFIKLTGVQIKINDLSDEDTEPFWRYFMYYKKETIYEPYIRALIWFLQNDEYIKSLCDLETHVERFKNSTKSYTIVKFIKLSLQQLKSIITKNNINMFEEIPDGVKID